MAVKVYTLSDLHVDYPENLAYLLSLTDNDFGQSALIIPGDASDNLQILRQLLSHLVKTFAQVFFVPGNHELWLRKTHHEDSLAKFDDILSLCAELGVYTQPAKVGHGDHSVWIVPLFSWYAKADEGRDSLYRAKPGDDQTEILWVDNRLCRWPSLGGNTRVVDHFLNLNQPRLKIQYDAPVISFSHFLPLQSLIFPIDFFQRKPGSYRDPLPQFNFSRVAGSSLLNHQIIELGSSIHVFGHQHRNRHRTVDGITYISHCLGYPKERQSSHWHSDIAPKLIWHDGPIDVNVEF